MVKTEADKAIEEALAVEARGREAATEATIRSLRRQVRDVERALGESLAFNDDLASAITALPKAKVIVPRPHKGVSDLGAVVLISDWHISSVILKSEMDAYNAYNYRIAQDRVRMYVAKVLGWVEGQRHVYTVDRLYLEVLGDIIHGELREEDVSTNEFRTPEAVVKAGALLGECIGSFAPHFKSVTVDLIGADNHARRSKKPPKKEAARNSYNYLIYEIVRLMLRDQPNVELKFHLPLKAETFIEGKRVLIEHGHTIRSWLGLPYYGMDRAEGREARKRLWRGRPYYLHLIGHWHVPAFGPFGVVNGALCGADPNDVSQGRHADPYQLTFLFHRKHGAFHFVPWQLLEGK